MDPVVHTSRDGRKSMVCPQCHSSQQTGSVYALTFHPCPKRIHHRWILWQESNSLRGITSSCAQGWTILCNISGDFIPGDQSHLHWLTKQPMTQCIIAPNHIHLEGHTFHGHLPASLRGHLCSPSSQMYQDRSLSVRRFPSRKITSSTLFGSPPFSIIMFLCY